MKGERPFFHRPEEGEVWVWQVSLGVAPAVLDSCRAVLSTAEMRRACRFLRPVHRRRYIACWGQLRWLLAGCLDLPPESLRFGRGTWGKPFLIDSKLHFNLSHSGDYLLVALTWGRLLGVDVEQVRPVSAMASLARRCFAAEELRAWEATRGVERERAFFKLWTLKESFVKADGRGLGLGVRKCVFTLDEPVRLVSVPEGCGRPSDWQIFTLETEEPVQVACCVRGGAVQFLRKTLAPNWLTGTSFLSGQGIKDRSGLPEASELSRDDQ